METITLHQEPTQYAEAYISDMLMLKNIFLQTQKCKGVDQNFGLPFLVAKRKNEIIAFASLVIDEKNEITFRVYDKKGLTEAEKKNFDNRAESCFKKNNTPNFRNPEQLKSSTRGMVSWLNL